VPIHLVHLNPLLLFAALAGVAAMLLARGVPGAHGEPGAADRPDGRAGTPPFLWFALAAVVVAGWLSLGPTVYSLGRRLDWGPYLFLYRHVPGFDGLRVPARLGMIAGLFLVVIAGVGAADLIRQWRYGAAAVFAAGLCFLAEVNPVPIAINRSVSDEPFGSLPARVETGDRVPGVYAFLRDTRPHAVVMEFPFGEYPLELRYVYYSTVHWCRLVNGFSGHFPASYEQRRIVLRHPLESPDLAWRMVLESGATFLLVHESYFPAGNGREVSRWLERHGARAVVAFGPDRVFEIR
jgi:hypothetical protein